MPEHSETILTACTDKSMLLFIHPVSERIGTRIVAASAENRLRARVTWIETTTTPQAYLEVWLAPETQDATP